MRHSIIRRSLILAAFGCQHIAAATAAAATAAIGGTGAGIGGRAATAGRHARADRLLKARIARDCWRK
jgi:hypothetical protein